ncbi:hypothetical protein Q0S19_13095 [Stenotrophomonas indicatrix]|uniref:hypothetical protein n=1 Tax=Stenotrophomonas indicatrix TaxID=2045451 RepID=UPI002655D548|nr:hypothetical protein [Stenotrophomonas indicatrix]MDN8645402.1 hypothetical protein [Stenotrophomonas indicatrix]MDN8656706.1 hypothetical protein [Stenotrophomonas indicatrix]
MSNPHIPSSQDAVLTPPEVDPAVRADTATPYRLGHALACAAVALLLGLTQGLGINLVNSNLGGVQGALGATASEAAWLTTAYYATNIAGVLLLTKVRFQFGLEKFAGAAIGVFVLTALAHLFAQDLSSAILVRATFGLVAAPLSSLAIFYMIQAMPAAKAPVGLLLGFGVLQLGQPLSRVISEDLLMHGQWRGLNLLDLALGVLSLTAIHTVRLRPVQPQRVFSRGDLVSFPLYACGFALLCVVFTQGRIHWWTDTPWLGWCLAGAVLCLGLYVLVEWHRTSPLVDLRWVVRPFMRRFILALVVFRVALVEQSTGAVGLMTALGFNNDQMHELFLGVTFATLAGFVLLVPLIASKFVPRMGLGALVLILIAASMDGDATVLTRPHDLYVSQLLLGLALAIFFSCAVIVGFGHVVADGMRNIIGFIAVFSSIQPIASLAGNAWLSSLVYQRQRRHYQDLSESVVLSDPQVADRIAHLGAALAPSLGDRSTLGANAAGLLAQQVRQQATVMAYNDLFHAVALLALGALLLFASPPLFRHMRECLRALAK